MLPEVWVQLTATLPSTASVAVGAFHQTCAPAAEVAVTVVFDGIFEITGAVVSLTITLKLAVEELPALSVAVQRTWVVVMEKVLPEGGEQTTETFVSRTSFAAG